jgi:hypothetical protein
MKYKVSVFCLILLSSSHTFAVTLPYFENFESEPTCATNCSSSCVLSTTGWTNLINDDQDWIVDSGGTASGSTGPSIDHNPGLSTGNYLYFEASSPCSNVTNTANLVSPPIELTNTTFPVLNFYYHMFGDHIGFLHIDILDSSLNVLELDRIAPITDNRDEWQQSQIIDLTPFIAQGTIHLQFRAQHSGLGFLGDMAIDDIAIEEFIEENIFQDSFEE